MDEIRIFRNLSSPLTELTKDQGDHQLSLLSDSGSIGPLDPPYRSAGIDDTGNEGRAIEVQGHAFPNKLNGELSGGMSCTELNPGDSEYAGRTIYNYFGFGIMGEVERGRGLAVEAVFHLNRLKIKDLVTPEHPDGTRAYFNHYIVFRIEILRQLDINFWVVVGYYDHIVLQSFYNERNGQEYNFNRTINDDSLRMQYDWSSGRDIGESETLLFKVGVQSTLYMHSNDCEFTTINSYTAQIEQVSASIITA